VPAILARKRASLASGVFLVLSPSGASSAALGDSVFVCQLRDFLLPFRLLLPLLALIGSATLLAKDGLRALAFHRIRLWGFFLRAIFSFCQSNALAIRSVGDAR